MSDNRDPSEDEIKRIENWSVSDPLGLLEFIRPLWEPYGCLRISGKRVKHVYMATGGWSGNEDIVDALHRSGSMLFWLLYWEKSARGGAFWFKIPPPPASKPRNL